MNEVYIDPLMVCVPNRNWKWNKACHMFVDVETDIEVLHRFAKKIGLRREWFQDKHSLPHYDLNPSRRQAAVAAGAVQVDRYEVVTFLERWREHAKISRNPRPLQLP